MGVVSVTDRSENVEINEFTSQTSEYLVGDSNQA